LKVLTFLYSHKAIARPYRHANYLVSVDEIEAVTGLDFLTLLPDDTENKHRKAGAGKGLVIKHVK
jgi:DNA/RNA endonuclease G (NUC1)